MFIKQFDTLKVFRFLHSVGNVHSCPASKHTDVDSQGFSHVANLSLTWQEWKYFNYRKKKENIVQNLYTFCTILNLLSKIGTQSGYIANSDPDVN